MLWGGFAAYLRGRTGWFCSAVLFVAMFKVMPILFLALLLPPRPGAEAPRRENLACVVFAVVAPRFKDYTYLMLIVPAFVLIEANPSMKRNLPLVVLLYVKDAGRVRKPGQAAARYAWGR